MAWPMVELGRAAEIRGGATPQRDNPKYWNGDIPWLTLTDLPPIGMGITEIKTTKEFITVEGLSACSTSLLPPGTVLFSSRASIGKVGIAAISLTTNQGFANLIPRPGVEARYLAWSMHFFADRIAGLAGSTTFKEVSKSSLKRFRVPLPPPSEQRRITEILDQADHLRRLRSEADSKADRILPALFINIFGDPILNPKQWATRPISELAVVTTGNTPPRARLDHFGHHIEWIKSNNLNTRSHYLTPAIEWLSESGGQFGRIVGVGSTLVTCIAGSPGAIGNAALANREVAFNQQINAATPKEGVNAYFLYAHFLVGKRLIQAASSGGMKGIVSKARFSEIHFLSPPPELQERFGKQCKELCDQNEARIRQGDHLHRLFSVLSHLGFRGDLTAPWREAHMKELLQEVEHQAKVLAVSAHAEVAQ